MPAAWKSEGERSAQRSSVGAATTCVAASAPSASEAKRVPGRRSLPPRIRGLPAHAHAHGYASPPPRTIERGETPGNARIAVPAAAVVRQLVAQDLVPVADDHRLAAPCAERRPTGAI